MLLNWKINLVILPARILMRNRRRAPPGGSVSERVSVAVNGMSKNNVEIWEKTVTKCRARSSEVGERDSGV